MIKIKILKEKENFIGGAGDNRPDSDFDPILLKKGKEKEIHDHGLNSDEAAEIAKDELTLNYKDYSKELEDTKELEEGYNHKQFIEWLHGKKEEIKLNDNSLLIESKLSKYWKKRAKRRALKAERKWPNKGDRDWALKEQEKSVKINEKIYALFEKELDESSCMSDDVDKMMRQMKKNRKEFLKKQEERKKVKLMHPKDRLKKVGGPSNSPKFNPEYGGVKKGYDINRKKAAKKGQVAIAPGAQFGPIEEEKKNENK